MGLTAVNSLQYSIVSIYGGFRSVAKWGGAITSTVLGTVDVIGEIQHGSEAQDLPQGFVFRQLIDMIVPGNSVRDGGSHQVRDGDLTLTKGQEFGTEIGTARLVTAEGDVVTAEAVSQRIAT
ncbi:MAG: hypothetical protein R3D32_09745 [Nitratireductor sp.]